MLRANRTRPSRGKPENYRHPGFCPSYMGFQRPQAFGGPGQSPALLPDRSMSGAVGINLSRDMEGVAAVRLQKLGEITSPIVPTATPRAARPSGTRCRRPTCGAVSPPACGRPRPAGVPCPSVWRRSCPRPAAPTIGCCVSAANGVTNDAHPASPLTAAEVAATVNADFPASASQSLAVCPSGNYATPAQALARSQPTASSPVRPIMCAS